MHLSAKTEYACIAVLELALRYGSEKPVRIRDIAEANGIPSRFLVQILLQLKAAGIVGSLRGAAGGYRLAKDPAEITLAEVMAASEAQLAPPVCSAARQTSTTKTLLAAWRTIADVQIEMLESVTFADLAADAVRRAGDVEQMYYI